ncbi:MATE family efflux transporter [Candidatus Peregrinibacteria bacterium]|nr:MATE family efflux transporter [Candidatus Peregrinibacteria bacterium]
MHLRVALDDRKHVTKSSLIMKRDFTKGPITASLLRLAIPIIAANIFHTVYQLTDTFWVGQLGKQAVAAVSLSFPILFLLIQFGIGLTVAGSILVAQYKGQRKQGKIDYYAAQTLSLMVIVSLVFAYIGFVSSDFFINLMNPEPSVAQDAVQYLQISFIGFTFMAVFFVYQSVVRGVGDVKTPLYIVIGTVLLNFFLDPLFILGWGAMPAFGVAGAALATVVTQSLSAIIGVILLLSGTRGVHLKPRHLLPRFITIKKLFLLGFPTSIEGSSRALSMVVMTFITSVFGTLAIASYGLGSRIFSFIIVPTIGLAMSTSTIVGQNIGAGKIDRARATMKKSMKIGFWALTIIGIILFIFAEQVVGAFVPGEVDVIRESTLFIRITSLTYGFVGMQMGAIGTLRGSGNTRSAMTLSILTIIIMVSTGYTLSHLTPLGMQGIWWAYAISNITGALLALMYITFSSWEKTRVIDHG